MIQGTASNAGKSLLAAGLCRLFRRDGLRVAPFKSQNMALNSYVTADGLEMGRAQVTQAECAGMAPDVRMNPILLKPTGESGSQVIVWGEVLGEMEAKEYYALKPQLVPRVREAYESLSSEVDVVVLEGAGSPAEINLREHDIVNMGMAKIARAPVLLAGDIDRGGVFASLAGTRLLLEPEEQDMIKGVIINKFRGDRSLLEPGLQTLEELMRCPVVGVVPWMDVDIDDEDSLSGRLTAAGRGAVDVTVVRFPRMANFTDFSSLGRLPGVGVRYAASPRQVGAPDLLVLPGSKSTMADLLWLRKTGLDRSVLEAAGKGIPVFGVCGGYQMLGGTLRDPENTELGGTLPGLGLLPCDTVFRRDKRRTQVEGWFTQMEGPLKELSGMRFSGYEIHTGRTEVQGPAMLSADGGGASLGCCRGSIYGTYVHGVFDSAQVAVALARTLFQAKGLHWDHGTVEDWEEYKQRQYDKLADILGRSLDMGMIYKILEEGI